MRTVILLIIIFFLCIKLRAEENSNPPPLTLQQCFERACIKNESLGLKEQDVRIAESHYWQAFSGLFPKITAKGTETFSTDGSGGLGSPITEGTSTSHRGVFGNNDNFQEKINLKQPLFNGFREFSAVKAASAEEQAEKFSLRRTRQLLYLDVADAFYQILSYEGDFAILKDLEKSLQDRVKELDHRVQLGRSRKSELLSAQTDLASAQATVEKTKELLAASRELLAFIIDLPADQIRLVDKTPFPAVDKIENYLAATGEHPDVLTQIQRLREAKGLLSVAKADHWPSVNVEGNYIPYNDPKTDQNWNILLTVEMPIFEGGLIEAKVRENEARVRQSELNLSQTQRCVEKNIRTSYSNFISAAAELARYTEYENISEQNLAEQKNDYDHGVTSNLDVLSALCSYHTARRQLLSSDYEARRDWIQLLVDAGNDVPQTSQENHSDLPQQP